MKNVKISVIVPIYNTEKYLAACLESCTKQTLRDIEILCVNDGSTDRSEEIVKYFQINDPRVKLINKENGGLPSARNAGIKNANGAVLMFLDSDDILSQKACERIWIEFRNNSADIIIFGTSCFPTYPEPDPWYFSKLQVQTQSYKEFTPEILFENGGAMPFVWRQAFSSSFLKEKNLMFDEKVIFGEDLVFQMEAFPNAKSIVFISDELYNYRWIRPGSMMSVAGKDIRQKIEYHLDNLEIICSYWEQRNWFASYGNDFMKWVIYFIIIDVLINDEENAEFHFQHLKKIIDNYQLNKYLKKLDPNARIYYREYKDITEKEQHE